MPVFLKPGWHLEFDYEWYVDQIYQELTKEPISLEKGQKFNPEDLDESKPNIFMSPERHQIVLIWNKAGQIDGITNTGLYCSGWKYKVFIEALHRYSDAFKYATPDLYLIVCNTLNEFLGNHSLEVIV